MLDPKTRISNENCLNGLVSDNPTMQKEATGGVNDYLRLRAREDGFMRRIQPPVPVTPSDFDRQVDTVKPVIVKDIEPNTPSAYSVPFGNTPINHFIDAPRYRIMFNRIMSSRFVADVANLLTYDMDIRQIFNDLMLKDILAEEDRKYTVTLNTACGIENDASKATNDRFAELGANGSITLGIMSRVSLANLQKGLPSTNRHLSAAVCLVNNVTIHDVVGQLDRAAIGGDLAEELFVNGFSERQIMGCRWFITIKTDLVPNDVIYTFAAPKFLGDCYTFEDVTVSTRHENFLFEMFAYEMLGATVKNRAAVCRGRFSGSYYGWQTAPV